MRGSALRYVVSEYCRGYGNFVSESRRSECHRHWLSCVGHALRYAGISRLNQVDVEAAVGEHARIFSLAFTNCERACLVVPVEGDCGVSPFLVVVVVEFILMEYSKETV